MTSIQSNDCFDELKAENKRLENELKFANKCLIVLNKIRFKLNQILRGFGVKSIQMMFNEEVIRIFKELDEEYNKIVADKQGIEQGETQFNEHSSGQQSNSIPIEFNVLKANQKILELKPPLIPTTALLRRVFTDRDNRSIGPIVKPISEVKSGSIEPSNTYESELIYDKLYYKCSINECNKNFETIPDLRRHQLKAHKDVDRHEIKKREFCVKSFKCEYNMKSGILCGLEFLNKTQIKQHIIRAHMNDLDQQFNQTLVEKKFKTEISDEINEPFVDSSNTSTKVSPNNQTMSSLTHKISINFSKIRQQINTSLLNSSTSSLTTTNAAKEMESDHQNYGLISSLKNVLKNAIQSAEGSTCVPPVLQQGGVATAGQDSQPNYVNAYYICLLNDCNKKYGTESDLHRHQREIHPDVDRNNIKMTEMYKKCFKCEYDLCGKVFHNKHHIKRHIIIAHKNELDFKCDHPGCGKRFKLMDILAKHQNRVHSKRLFKCNHKDCNYRSKDMTGLKKHQRFTHSNHKPFVCDVSGCDKHFKTKSALYLHVYVHKNESPVICPIDGCGKYVKTHRLRMHLCLHSTEYVSCDWKGCHYKCKSKYSLKKHKIRHSSERNKVCSWPECYKLFKTSADLSKHEKSHTNDKDYPCDWPGCLFKTQYQYNLAQHLKTHNNERPYVCEWPGCQYRSTVGSNLRKHQKRHQKC